MKYLLAASVVFILMIASATATRAAGEVGITLDTNAATLTSGGTRQVVATITNNQQKVDTFTLSIFPPSWLGTTTTLSTDRVTLAPGASQDVTITFGASDCVQEFSNLFSVTARSLSDNTLQNSATLKLTTVRMYQVCISSAKFDMDSVRPGDTLTLTVSIENPASSESLPVSLTVNVKNSAGNVLQTFSDSIDTIQGTSTVDKSYHYTFGNFSQPGNYVFDIELFDSTGKTINSQQKMIQLKSVNQTSQTKDISYGMLLQTVTITVKNDGNLPVNNIFVHETIPNFMKLFFYPKDTPASESTNADTTTYSWLIPTILPGEQKTITYQIAVWNAVLVIIGIVVLVLVIFRTVFTVRIVKSYKKFATVAGAKEIQIQLEIRNRSRHVHKDVIVRDLIPSTAVVIDRFDTMRPSIRKLPGGTELVWKFETLRPHEERVITYRIKPSMEIVGEILLPTSSVRYIDRNKQVRRSVSKSVEIKV